MVCAELNKLSDSVTLVDGINKTMTFPSGSSFIIFYFNFTEGNVSLEAGIFFIASLKVVGDPESVLLGTPNQTTINVLYDEGRHFSVCTFSSGSRCLIEYVHA